MKSKINFRQRKLAEHKSLVLILDPKTGRKKKKWKQAVPSEWLCEERSIMNKDLAKKKRQLLKILFKLMKIFCYQWSQKLIIKKMTKTSLK